MKKLQVTNWNIIQCIDDGGCYKYPNNAVNAKKIQRNFAFKLPDHGSELYDNVRFRTPI